MTIEDCRVSHVEIPLAVPFVTALRRVEAATAVRLEIFGGEGRIGIGEAPPTVAITGESEESIRRTIETALMPRLLQRSFGTLPEALERLQEIETCGSGARAAVDIALHDLFGAWSSHDITVRTAVTVSLASPEAMERQAIGFAERGCTILKVKLGGRDGADTERIRRIREALPEAILLADANQAWNETETFRFLETMQPYEIALLEQPLPAKALEGMARITACSPVPILADESAFTLDDVRKVVESGAAHMINVKLMKCGGVAPAREILRWCEDYGIFCMMGSMLETPASIAAAMRIAHAFADTVRYADLDSPLLWKTLPGNCPIEREGDRLTLLH